MASEPVIVVGAGIIGASIAWHLTEAGASVVALSSKQGGVATPSSFGWINASWGNPEFYCRFRIHAMNEWGRLAQAVPGVQFSRCGGICWDLPPPKLEDYAREHSAWGYNIRRIDREEIARLEPNLTGLPDFALHAVEEGAAEPMAAAIALIADAERRGATILTGVHATALVSKGGRMAGVVTTAGEIAASRVVLAAGTDTARLASSVGIDIPLEAPPGLLVHSRPAPKALNGLVMADKAHIRQTREGRIVAGSDFGGTDPGGEANKAAAELFAAVQALLPNVYLEMDFHTVGYRPTPKDGFPIVGPTDCAGLYVAALHSGVTLAPLVGRLAAAEILTGESELMLDPYRLSRFA
ncbi:FAD-binding oxidoreductase [Pararhizobium sp. A13]|uniref:NAD(P)/FAD-dependent oxidoreductase n=1 Tax=Pararhizobium sp. A13 TaxID=3133975 RepID=UPI003243AC89